MQTKDTEGDKTRSIIRHLHDSDSDSDFDKFLDSLKSFQPNVANRINSVKNQVKLSRKTVDTDSEDNFASDFDPGTNDLHFVHLFLFFNNSMHNKNYVNIVKNKDVNRMFKMLEIMKGSID